MKQLSPVSVVKAEENSHQVLKIKKYIKKMNYFLINSIGTIENKKNLNAAAQKVANSFYEAVYLGKQKYGIIK